MTTENKAKRVIKKFDFSGEGCAVSLVGPSVGGGANGKTVLLTKSKSPKVSDEFIKKASTVKVTMDINDFLQKLFGVWYEDAEVLARALGFTTKQQDWITEHPEYAEEDWYEEYITEKVQSIEVMKSLYQAENMANVLAELDGPQYLALVQDQAMLEKSFRKIERINKAKESKPTGEDTSKSNEVDKGVSSPVIKQTKETNMDEKEKLEALQKSFEDSQVMLQKALDEVNTLKAEKQEQVIKSKTAKITEIIKDESQAKAIVKAALALDNEVDFNAFVVAVEAIAKAVDKSELFIEKGLQVDNAELQPTESAVMKAVKARVAKAAK
jgi:hypothetical protein